MQAEIRETDLAPDRACALLAKLSALLGNINEEVLEADMAYNAVYLQHLESSEAANRAKIRAETTTEYRRKREATNLQKLVLSLTSALKALIRAKQEEMRLAR